MNDERRVDDVPVRIPCTTVEGDGVRATTGKGRVGRVDQLGAGVVPGEVAADQRAGVDVSVRPKALFVASTSIGWLNQSSTVAGSTSTASASGSVFVTCAPGWTMNEKLPLPPITLPVRSCEPMTLIV